MENELKKILGTNLLMEILKNNKLLLLNYTFVDGTPFGIKEEE